MAEKKKLLLLDGSSLAFRSFYGLLDLSRFQNQNGLHTNALYAFHRIIHTLFETENPTHMLVAFDAGKTTFRTEFYDDYKGGRQSMPAELAEQWPYFKVLLSAMGVKSYELANYEADDIIGTLSRQGEAAGFDVVIISGDKDLTQLATDQTRVDITVKGVSELKSYTPESIREEMGIDPLQIIDLKGLMGDSSDNYPGVRKVGEKTALKLLKEYGSIEQLYEQIDAMKESKMKENLVTDKENAFLSKRLATIDVETPIELTLEELAIAEKKEEELIAFYREMNFNSFLRDLNYEEEDRSESFADITFTALDEIKAEHFSDEMALYVEMLENNYHFGKIVALSWGNGTHIYTAKPEVALQSEAFKKWAEDASMKKQVYDAKRTKVMLHYAGVELAGIDFDMLLASYIINTKDSGRDVAAVAQEYGHQEVSFDETIYGKGAKTAVPADWNVVYEHLARKVAAIHQLMPTLNEELEKNNQHELYYDMELPLAIILADMEIAGIRVEPERLEKMKIEFSQRLEEIEKQIHAEAGEAFNINSPKQLSVILFEKMGLPPIKKTKTGYSTAVDVLEKLSETAPIAQMILDYRQLAKLQSTYVEGLLKFIKPETGKVHTIYTQTLTQTGRLSSNDPNLQNIPIRMEEGRKIRQAFVPSQPSWKIFASDYSQIELRVLAHISKDEHMQAAFIEGQDIHTSTAMRVFGIADEASVTSNVRRQAKAVNFGIVYGISDYGLSQNLGITRNKAKDFIDRYFEKYPGIKQFMEDIVVEAREKGFVETLYHRRRYLPDINSRNFNLRSFAERTAINSPIQGTAADILKVAMIRMQKALKEQNLKAKMLLQVHDELIFECPAEEVPLLEKLVPEMMENAVELSVPLEVDSNFGDNWYEAK
ncbi:DNA polymerase I [Jeotgalibaca caeni]|uniref:DNA polymerase I n=1 Tax=Jeotgalibaca caeni TaxID=3028623 RepID=UPI00237E11A7|nr:DNA polymerase I [Jeotgalibaca caeni]MDE1548654.1 DNA polymerase I [Jeotgalibaca caeni]